MHVGANYGVKKEQNNAKCIQNNMRSEKSWSSDSALWKLIKRW